MAIGNSTESHLFEVDTLDYWDRTVGGLSITNASYRTSITGDTLSIHLKAPDLEKELQVNSHLITDYKESSGTRSFTRLNNSSILKISDSAYANITVIGNFPLSVTPFSHREIELLTFYPLSKILKLFGQAQNQNRPLPCYDILGRKHNLEFLGSDGNSSTYSVRSLPAGVYFVNDGKETAKFMIAE